MSMTTTDNLCFYLQNRLIQTCETGGQWYSDTSPFSIPCSSCFQETVQTWFFVTRFRPDCDVVGRRGHQIFDPRARLITAKRHHPEFFLVPSLAAAKRIRHFVLVTIS